MSRQWLTHRGRLMALLLMAYLSPAFCADRMTFMTGPEQTGQGDVARDLARYVARPAGVDVAVAPGAGPVDSLLRLRDSPGMQLALLPADVAYAYQDAAIVNPDASQIMAPVRVIAPLHRETFYFIVRSDAQFNSVRDIRDARINVGPVRSGSALSFAMLYNLLFDGPMRDDKSSFFGHEEALAKLITDQSVDVVVLVAGQPARLLAGMKPEARRFIKLLKVDAADANSTAISRLYEPTVVSAASYPNVLTEDLSTLSVRLYWVAYGYRRGVDDAKLSRLVRAWCQNLPRLKAEGNPQWQEVDLGRPELRVGWTYARAARRELAHCLGVTDDLPADICSGKERILGLCD